MNPAPSTPALIQWSEGDEAFCLRWRSENGTPAPRRVVAGDDTLTADAALRLANEGTAIIWRGDYHAARQLLQAMQRRLDKKRRPPPPPSLTEIFHQQRMMQMQRARILGMVLLVFEAGHRLDLRRAPDLSEACIAAYGPDEEPYVVSLRELLGVIGSYEWRRKGVEIPALGGRIHPHYGVFSPVRGEYVDLVAQAPLPPANVAYDIGTGTGVLAALLARRGIGRVVATDQDARALACARDNIERLGVRDGVDIVKADLFPEGRADLIVCNPPWLPGRPSSALEYAVYDPDHRMLNGFLEGLPGHLNPGGEGWLIMSDLAERLGLRPQDYLQQSFSRHGLRVLGRLDTRPRHSRSTDREDPLHVARAAEITSLWRLGTA